IAGVSKVSAPKFTREVVEFRGGGEEVTRKYPGQTKYEGVTLERGLADESAFRTWAAKQPGEPGFFKDSVIIEVLDERFQLAVTYNLKSCWVSEYQPIPEFDSSASAVAIEMVKIECESFELA
ncbi:MAG: phage tail protein, partial [Myxococcota bacterium]